MNALGHSVQPRVGQLDASLLDAELADQLKDRLYDAFKFWRPDLKDSYEAELQALLKAALFKATVWDHATTYGAKLQNLRLVNSKTTAHRLVPVSRKQKALYGVVTILGSYLWTKLSDYLSAASYDSDEMPVVVRLRALADRLQFVWLGASMANFVAFLYSGTYSTLVLRLLRMKWIPVQRKVGRMVNYEFQNRQLVWNAMTEFLLFVLPLVNFGTIKRYIRKVVPASAAPDTLLPDFPLTKCVLCHEKDAKTQTLTNPQQVPCGHLYCYICLQIKLSEEPEGFGCPRCGKLVKEFGEVELPKGEKPAEPNSR